MDDIAVSGERRCARRVFAHERTFIFALMHEGMESQFISNRYLHLPHLVKAADGGEMTKG